MQFAEGTHKCCSIIRRLKVLSTNKLYQIILNLILLTITMSYFNHSFHWKGFIK